MGIFSTSSALDPFVEKATSENNTNEDWGKIIEVCDKIKETENGHVDGIRAISKRLKSDNPRVVLQAITLLDACVNNCGRKFHLKVAEREFEQELSKLITNRHTHQKASQKLRECLKQWSEDQFKLDPELSLIPALLKKLALLGYSFEFESDVPKKTQFSTDPNVVNNQQEEDDIARAIELSLKDSGSSSLKGSSKPDSGSLYSSASAVLSDYSASAQPEQAKEPMKVRALYDFEAAEENELTFKTGEIVFVLDNTDANWWKGSNHRGEGLFPSNFVTENLDEEQYKNENSSSKKVSFNESVVITEVSDTASEVTGEVDVEKVDQLLHVLHDADPTGEMPDDVTLPALEDQVNAMAPTIDAELEQIDRRHAQLARLSTDLGDALELYQQLMRDMPAAMPYYMPYNNPMQHPPMPNQPYNPAADLPPSYMSLTMPGMHQMYPPHMTNAQQPYMPQQPMGVDPYAQAPGPESHPAPTMPQVHPQQAPDQMPMSPPAVSSGVPMPNSYSYAMYAPAPDHQAIYTQAPVPQPPMAPSMPSHVQPSSMASQAPPPNMTLPQGQPPIQGYMPQMPHGAPPSSVPFYPQSMQQPLL